MSPRREKRRRAAPPPRATDEVRSATPEGTDRGATPQRAWAYPAIIAILAILASVWGIGNEFVQDDEALIGANDRVRDLSAIGRIFTSPYWPPPYPPDLYRPLTTLFHALLHAVGDGSTAVFRIASYILYAAASVGVFLLGRRFLPALVALTVAVIFAVHPVHVEAVALAVAQGELVVAIAALAMTGVYITARRLGRLGASRTIAIASLYLLASGFKEQGLVLPALLIAAEIALLEGSMRERVTATWKLYTVLTMVAVAVLAARATVLGGNPMRSFVAEALVGLSPAERMLTMLGVVPEWFRLLVWPAHLRADYSPNEFVAARSFGAAQLIGLSLLAGTTFVAFRMRRAAPVVTFGVLWFFVAILPVSNVIVPTGILLAERTLFLPSVGFMLALGGVAANARMHEAAGQRRVAFAGAIALMTVAGLARSAERHLVWRNTPYYWFRAAQDAPRSYRTQYVYGQILFRLGLRPDAERAFRRAIEAAPDPWRMRYNFGQQLRAAGDDSAAVEQLALSFEERRDDATLAELVAALIGLGRYSEAAQVARNQAGAGPSPVVEGLAALADSARDANAPPGAVRVRLHVTEQPIRYTP